MPAVESQMLPLATQAPAFTLPDPDGTLHSLRDDSRPSNSLPVDVRDLRAALDAVLASEQPEAVQKPSIGCSINWIAGNQPEYF